MPRMRSVIPRAGAVSTTWCRAGMTDSPPSREKRFCPMKAVCMKLLELLRAEQVLQDDALLLRVEGGTVARGFHLLDQPAPHGLVLDVEELHRDGRAVGVLEGRDDLGELHGPGRTGAPPVENSVSRSSSPEPELGEGELGVGMGGLRVEVGLFAFLGGQRVQVGVDVARPRGSR